MRSRTSLPVCGRHSDGLYEQCQTAEAHARNAYRDQALSSFGEALAFCAANSLRKAAAHHETS
jgi:hypothetical protein